MSAKRRAGRCAVHSQPERAQRGYRFPRPSPSSLQLATPCRPPTRFATVSIRRLCKRRAVRRERQALRAIGAIEVGCSDIGPAPWPSVAMSWACALFAGLFRGLGACRALSPNSAGRLSLPAFACAFWSAHLPASRQAPGWAVHFLEALDPRSPPTDTSQLPASGFPSRARLDGPGQRRRSWRVQP